MKQKYRPENVLEKTWFEQFDQIHLKETVIKSFIVKLHPGIFLKKGSITAFSPWILQAFSEYLLSEALVSS